MSENIQNSNQQQNINRDIGVRLKLLREMTGQTQSVFAAKLGVSFQQLQKYEQGRTQISAQKLWNASQLLQADVGFFFNGIHHDSTDKEILKRISKRKAASKSNILN